MIENLRKQAKQLLRWHRQGYYPVAQRLRAALPRYEAWSDGEILAAPFTLGQAQELLARENGFDSWAALLAEGNAMSTSTPIDAPVLVAAYPQLFVRDVTASCAFFTERLGFSVAYVYGEPPFYGLVRRGGAALNLRFTARPAIDPSVAEEEESLLAANIPVTGVKELFLEYQAAGVAMVQPLRPQPWGVSDFVVADPDGNLLCFAEATV